MADAQGILQRVFDDGAQALRVLLGGTVSDDAPSSPVEGDFWYESDTGSFFVRVGGSWVEIAQGTPLHANLTDLTTSGHPASAIAFTPNGSIAATNVQDAIVEVRDEAGSALAIGAAVGGQTDNTILFTDASGNLDDNVLTIEQSTLSGLADYTRVTAPVASAGGPGWANATALGAPFDVSGWFLDPFDLFAVTDPVGLKSAMLILNDTPGTILPAGHFGIGLGGSNPVAAATSAIYLDVTKSDGSTDVTFGTDIDVLDFSGNVLTDIGNGSASSDAAAYGQIIPKTLIDAKGDLIVGTAADTAARLAVGGTNGHVLMVDSAEAAGMKWASVSASPGGSDTQVQFNDGGSFGGDSLFVFNKTTNLITLGDTSTTGGILIPRVNADSYIAVGPQGYYGPAYSVNEPHVAINTVRLIGGGSGGSLTVKSHTGAMGSLTTGTIYAATGYISANGRTGFSVGENFNNTAATMGVGVATSNSPEARLYVQPESAHISYYASIDGIRVKAQTSQTGRLLRAVNTSDTELWSIDITGAMKPASMADSAASNDRVYYSTDASKLVYKDSGGTVNALY